MGRHGVRRPRRRLRHQICRAEDSLDHARPISILIGALGPKTPKRPTANTESTYAVTSELYAPFSFGVEKMHAGAVEAQRQWPLPRARQCVVQSRGDARPGFI